MILGRVCGTIHSTINHEFYDSKRLLLEREIIVNCLLLIVNKKLEK